jgi:SAM-dependent methyltransferase
MYQNDWDKSAPEYVDLPDVSNVEINYRAVLRHIGECQGKAVLDFGCGGGRLSFELEKMGARVVGVDLSLPCIEIAQETAGRLGSTVQFVSMRGNHLDFLPSRTIDIAVTNLVFMMSESKEAIAESMREICRVLRGTGRFINVITHPCFVDRGAHDYRNVFPDGFDYFREGFAYKFILRDGDGCEVDRNFHDHHYTASTYVRLTLQSGFDITDFEELGYSEEMISAYGIPEELRTFPLAILMAAKKRKAHR